MKTACPLHCNGQAVSCNYFHSMVNIWLLLYMVDNRRLCFPYFAALSRLYCFSVTFVVKMRSRFTGRKLSLTEVFKRGYQRLRFPGDVPAHVAVVASNRIPLRLYYMGSASYCQRFINADHIMLLQFIERNMVACRIRYLLLTTER